MYNNICLHYFKAVKKKIEDILTVILNAIHHEYLVKYLYICKNVNFIFLELFDSINQK